MNNKQKKRNKKNKGKAPAAEAPQPAAEAIIEAEPAPEVIVAVDEEQKFESPDAILIETPAPVTKDEETKQEFAEEVAQTAATTDLQKNAPDSLDSVSKNDEVSQSAATIQLEDEHLQSTVEKLSQQQAAADYETPHQDFEGESQL